MDETLGIFHTVILYSIQNDKLNEENPNLL
jgi:hypothetical protein